MENASKALLIAGGVLFTMLIVGVIVFARDRFSEYYSSQSVIKGIENTAEFNKQFTNYERESVTGNELISLINKVIDYNDRESSAVTNNSQASPITIEIDFDDHNKEFLYEASGENYLFKDSVYTQAGSDYSGEITHYSFKNYIIEKVKDAIEEVSGLNGTEEEIEKIARDIRPIFNDYNAGDEGIYGVTTDQKKAAAIKRYNSYIKNEDFHVNTWNELLNKKDAVYKYYEYVQFKKGIFRCTGIDYNTSTGRVKTLNFVFTGKIQ